jgi:phospholipase A1
MASFLIWSEAVYKLFIGLIVCIPLLVFGEENSEFVGPPQLSQQLELSNQESVIEEKRNAERKINLIDFAIALNRPTYILPYYYTASPDQHVYEGDTPLNQRINQNEFKFQLSLLVPVVQSVMGTPLDINLSYTQMSYWQVYTTSAWFRETDYEPELIFNYTLNPNNQVGVSLNHESNGRGGTEERAWNRVIGIYTYGHSNWMLQARAWVLIFKGDSSDIYNPDITDYLGHGDLTASYEINKLVLSVTGGNFERFNRSHFQGSLSYPITNKIRFYGQAYSGYGQSLIEYNHRTNAFGVGISFNDWL